MQQTIKMKVSEISDHVENNDTFIQTNFDELVDELYDGLLDRYLLPVGKTYLNAGDFIICIIEYREMTPEEKTGFMKYKASKSGIYTDLNIDMNNLKKIK